MNTRAIAAVAAFVASIVVVSTAHPQPFTNGGFELPRVTGVYAGPIPGWDVTKSEGRLWDGAAYGGITSPAEGTQHFEIGMNDWSHDNSISQTFSTVQGQQYRVSFQVGWGGNDRHPRKSVRATVVSDDGRTLASFDADAPATRSYGAVESFTFTAKTEAATLSFLETSPDHYQASLFLDNVRLEMLPGPGACRAYARRVAGTSLETDELVLGLAADGGGSVYVAGWFDGSNDFGGTTLTSYGGQDAFVAKYNCAGQLQWVRQGGGADIEPNDADYWDHARGVGVDAGGNVYVTGGFLGQARFEGISLTSTNTQDAFLAKYSPDGDLLWIRQGRDSEDCAYGTGIAVDAAGTTLVVGYFDGDTVSFDGVMAANTSGHHTAFLVKHDSAGTVQWACGLGGGRAYSTTVGMDAAGNCYVGGGFEGTLELGAPSLTAVRGENGFLAKFDSAGVLQWVRQIKGPTFDGGRLGVDSSGSCYLVGSAFEGVLDFDGQTITNTNPSLMFTAKYDTWGAVKWVQQAVGAGTLIYNEGECGVDQAGNCYIPGVITDSADFSGTIIASRGGWDTFVAKYDAAGNFQWVQTAGGTLDDGAFRLALDASGTPHIAGWFQGTATFGSDLLQAQGYRDVFLARLSTAPEFCCSSISNGVFYTRLTGPIGMKVVALVSPDLTTWTPWQTNTLPAGGLPLAVPMGTSASQYLRAQTP